MFFVTWNCQQCILYHISQLSVIATIDQTKRPVENAAGKWKLYSNGFLLPTFDAIKHVYFCDLLLLVSYLKSVAGKWLLCSKMLGLAD